MLIPPRVFYLFSKPVLHKLLAGIPLGLQSEAFQDLQLYRMYPFWRLHCIF
jgi:hypothetical protein